jgi:hypothetical protein
MDKSGSIKIFLAIVMGIMLISAGITGRPGSLLGSLIDAEDMTEIGQF